MGVSDGLSDGRSKLAHRTHPLAVDGNVLFWHREASILVPAKEVVAISLRIGCSCDGLAWVMRFAWREDGTSIRRNDGTFELVANRIRDASKTTHNSDVSFWHNEACFGYVRIGCAPATKTVAINDSIGFRRIQGYTHSSFVFFLSWRHKVCWFVAINDIGYGIFSRFSVLSPNTD